MKTILYVYHTSSIGGGSYCLLNILKAVDRSLVKPVVLLKENGPLVEEIQKLDIKVFFLSKLLTVLYNSTALSKTGLKKVFNILTSLSDYKKILQKVKPDVVYLNTMMFYPYLRPAKQLGIKTIIHVREHWPEGEHLHQRNLALRQIDKYADHIVAINSYSASMLDFSSKPKTIVYDWIDMSARYEECPLSEIFGEPIDDKKIYLYMGGMQGVKGPKEVITTFVSEIKDPSARLLVMGIKNSYSRGLRGKIKKVLQKIGKPTYTDVVLNTIHSDSRIKCIPSTYKVSHIIQQSYCILSYFTIPHANLALAESIILGTPTIAADTSESREYSLDGRLASLYRINDINEFKSAVRAFEIVRLGMIDRIKAESNKIQQMFDPKLNANKLNEIFKTI